MILARNYTVVWGIGKHEDELVAFDYALKNAGIHKFNLVPVSSIIPTEAEFRPKSELKEIPEGTIMHVVISKINAKKDNVDISAGLAIVSDKITREKIVCECSGEMEKSECRSILCKRVKYIADNHDLVSYKTQFEVISAKTSKDYYTCIVVAVCLW